MAVKTGKYASDKLAKQAAAIVDKDHGKAGKHQVNDRTVTCPSDKCCPQGCCK